VQRLQKLRGLLHVKLSKLAEVIVDGRDLVQVVHWVSVVGVKKIGGTKNPAVLAMSITGLPGFLV
jgi:hypothetical protein